MNLIEGPKEQYFQLGEGISLGSYGKRTTVNETTTLQEYLQKPFDERTTNGRRTIYEARQYDGNIYRPGFYKEDVDKLMNNPLWKKTDMLLKISGPAINEYVPNNLGAGFNRGYGYFLEHGHFISVTTKEKQLQDCSGLMELIVHLHIC